MGTVHLVHGQQEPVVARVEDARHVGISHWPVFSSMSEWIAILPGLGMKRNTYSWTQMG